MLEVMLLNAYKLISNIQNETGADISLQVINEKLEVRADWICEDDFHAIYKLDGSDLSMVDNGHLIAHLVEYFRQVHNRKVVK